MFKHYEGGAKLSNMYLLRAIFLYSQDINWYPYPCVLAVMAHKTALVVFERQDRRIPLIFLVMFRTTETQVFHFNESPITFSNGDSVMVNATQMASGFSKKPVEWMRNQQTKEFISELSKVRNLTFADLVIVKQGSPENGGGTWLHEDVAIEFARWLSPTFAIWCNDRIKELLTQGVATTSNDDEAILHAMQVLQKRVEASKQKIQMLEGANEMQKEQIKLLAPKAEYTDAVLQSTTTYTFTQIAKDCEMTGATTLANFLISKQVIYRQSGQYMPTAKYSKSGYFKNRTHTYENSRGEKGTNTILVVTEAGRQFIHNLISKNA